MPNLGSFLVLFTVFLITPLSVCLSSVSPQATMSADPTHVLYDLPISNHGARCRLILYSKGIPPSEVTIVSPGELGGLKSEAYLQANPQGKMPLLKCAKSNLFLPESDTIARYLLSQYAELGPSFQPENPLANLIARIHDMYISPIQAAMYKAGPFGPYGRDREAALDGIVHQLRNIESQANINTGNTSGPAYLCGNEITMADVTVFPTLVFCEHMLPKFGGRQVPSDLLAWFHAIRSADPNFARVYDEIKGAISRWENKKRWEGILGAGWRDEAPATLFDKIVAGDIPAAVVRQDEHVLAFKDINPAAPAHVLVIPKKRNALTNLRKATAEHQDILGHLMVTAADIARDTSLGFGDGARFVINDGPEGGQEVMHLHVHVLGGRSFQWPPG